MARPKSYGAKARARTPRIPTVSESHVSSGSAPESTKSLIVSLKTKRKAPVEGHHHAHPRSNETSDSHGRASTDLDLPSTRKQHPQGLSYSTSLHRGAAHYRQDPSYSTSLQRGAARRRQDPSYSTSLDNHEYSQYRQSPSYSTSLDNHEYSQYRQSPSYSTSLDNHEYSQYRQSPSYSTSQDGDRTKFISERPRFSHATAPATQPRFKILRIGHYAEVEAIDGSRDLVPVEALLSEYEDEISQTPSLPQTSFPQANPSTTDTMPERSRHSIDQGKKRKYEEEKETGKINPKHTQERLDGEQRSAPKVRYNPRASVPKDWSKKSEEVQEQDARRKVQRKVSKKNRKSNQRLDKKLAKLWRNEHSDQ